MPNLNAPSFWWRAVALCGGALYFSLSCLIAAVPTTGAIAGRVLSAVTGQPIAGATVHIAALDREATTDMDGAFRFEGLDAGTYGMVVNREGYRNTQLDDLNVIAGVTERCYVPLDPIGVGSAPKAPASSVAAGDEVIELEALTVQGTVAQGSALSLLSDRQKAVSVSDAIGEDMISRLGVGDAAEAMSKVTGASIIDGKYVMVRGLGDRYSNTLLNGMTVPSADPDRRAVQMDQFPSSVLESIVTSKSFTPDQPGGFSGGSVNLRTKSFPEHFFFSLGSTLSFDSESTNKSVLAIPGGGSDWLGRDDGTRALPDGLPDRIPSQTEARLAAQRGDFAPAEELDRVSHSFANESYFPRERNAGPNFGFNFAVGDRLSLGGERQLGYVVSFTYDRKTRHFTDGFEARYSQGSLNPDSPSFVDGLLVYSPNLDDLSIGSEYAANPEVPGGAPSFGVTRTSEDVDWGGYAQLAIKPSLNHEATLRFLHNQSATDQVKHGAGESTRSDAGRLFQNYDLIYTERAMDSVQLSGQSYFPGLHEARLEWRASTSRSTQDQPDYRTLSYFWDFVNQQFASAAGVGNNRVFRAIDEQNDELGFDVTVPFLRGGALTTLKFGANWQEGGRTYRERRFRWSREANQIDLIENYPNPVGIISRTSNSVVWGNTISELSNRLLNYDGDQTISAAYAMADVVSTGKWRVTGGLRAEQTQISTAAAATSATFRAADIDQTDILPALGVVYALQPTMNLRAAYGRTVARPLYRELADVRIDDFFRDTYFTGNPDLAMSQIDNLDLRWEWFPAGGEIFAAGVFYKDFSHPIEVLLDGRTGAEQPRNLDSGKVYGLELEARFGLNRLSSHLDRFSMGANVTLIASESEIPPAELATIRSVFPDASDTRPLFGQSPYIVNVDLTYAQPNSGTSVTLAGNFVGPRIALVTADALPDIYERPAPELDVLISQRLWSGWRVKFSAKNLLDRDFEKSFRHADTTYFYERHRRGRTFTVGLSYLFE